MGGVGIDLNQITLKNTIKIKIFDDSWNLFELAIIKRAYVKYDKKKKNNAVYCVDFPEHCKRQPVDNDFHDLGILLPKKGTTFKHFNQLVVPLCLPAETASIPKQDNELITFVGWGSQYNEIPKGSATVPPWDETKRNPITTSCTTNQYGVLWDTTAEEIKFKMCRVKFLKDYVEKNGWKGCKKCSTTGCTPKDLPINYEFDKCENYWREAKNVVEKNDKDKRRKFENVMKIKIESACENWEPECLNLKLFSKYGWCEVEGGSIDDWAICDLSCKHVKVLHFYFDIFHFHCHYYLNVFVCVSLIEIALLN